MPSRTLLLRVKNTNFKGYCEIWMEVNDFSKPKHEEVMLKCVFFLDKKHLTEISHFANAYPGKCKEFRKINWGTWSQFA